jgi:hypothetical protein
MKNAGKTEGLNLLSPTHSFEFLFFEVIAEMKKRRLKGLTF